MWILQSKLLSSNKIISIPSKCGIHAFTETFPFTLKIHLNMFYKNKSRILSLIRYPEIFWLTYLPLTSWQESLWFFWEFLRISEKYRKERRKHGILKDSAREIDFYRQFLFCLQTHESWKECSQKFVQNSKVLINKI